jgi:hypothetical protein
MELASTELIHGLIEGAGTPAPARVRRRAQAAAPPTSRDRKVRCKCGLCRQCLDDARWDRIFAEKFADPDYYTRPLSFFGSPLTSF